MACSPPHEDIWLRPGLTIIALDDAVQLRGGDEEIFVIQSERPDVVERVLRALLDGQTRECLGQVAGPEHAELLRELLAELEAQQLLRDQPLDERDEIARYLSHEVHSGSSLPVRRPTGSVGVIGQSPSADLLSRALGEHGLDVHRLEPDVSPQAVGLPGSDVRVCVWEQADLRRILDVNAAACQHRQPCLFVDLSHGRHATLGPFYLPGETACYACYRERWRQNTSSPAEFDAAHRMMVQGSTPLASYGLLPAFRYQVVGLACAELFAFLSKHRPLRTANRVATLDLEGLRIWSEPAWRIPWCPACGVAS